MRGSTDKMKTQETTRTVVIAGLEHWLSCLRLDLIATTRILMLQIIVKERGRTEKNTTAERVSARYLPSTSPVDTQIIAILSLVSQLR